MILWRRTEHTSGQHAGGCFTTLNTDGVLLLPIKIYLQISPVVHFFLALRVGAIHALYFVGKVFCHFKLAVYDFGAMR